MAVWEDTMGVVAWGRVEPPNHLGLHVDPAHPEVAHAVLDWFETVTARPGRTVTVLETEQHLVTALQRAGYQPLTDAPFFLHCVVELDHLPAAVPLPDGYRCRAVRADETEARAAAHRAAWRPARIGALLVPPVDLGDAESDMTAGRYRVVMNTWPYRRSLDQVVEAPDGSLVASALGWLDDANTAGELEPVGTDPRHSRRGLATAVSLACLHALRDAGATRAVVYPRGDSAYPVPRQLYAQLGFQPVTRTVTYHH